MQRRRITAMEPRNGWESRPRQGMCDLCQDDLFRCIHEVESEVLAATEDFLVHTRTYICGHVECGGFLSSSMHDLTTVSCGCEVHYKCLFFMARIMLLWDIIEICENMNAESEHRFQDSALHQWYRQDNILLCDRCNGRVEQECPFMAAVREIPPMHSELVIHGTALDCRRRTVLRNAFLQRHF